MRTRTVLACALACPVLMAACDGSPAEPERGGPDADVVQAFISAVGTPTTGGTGPCPAGGERDAEFDAQVTQSATEVTVTWSITLVFRACAIQLQDDTLVTDGTLDIEGFERRERSNEIHLGRVLERTAHQTGTLRWRTRTMDRTCALDLTNTFDAATSQTRIIGTICGDAVDFTIMVS
jgi:hypothetical protein